VDEAVTVIVSEKGWVRTRQGHGHDATQSSFKSGDGFDGAYEVRSTDFLLVIGSDGRVFSVPVSTLPGGRGDGQPVTSLIDLAAGTKVAWVFAAAADGGILLATDGGIGLSCQGSDWVGRNRSGKSFMSIEPGDHLLRPALVGSASSDMLSMRVACLSTGGRLLTYPVTDVKVLRSGGRGSTLMALESDERLSALVAYGPDGVLVRGTGRAAKAVERTMSGRELGNYDGARGRKGRLLEPRVRDGSMVCVQASAATSGG